MMMEPQFEEKPKKQESKEVYTIHTALIHFTIGFVGWFAVMTIVSVLLDLVVRGMGSAAMALGICFPINIALQIVITLMLFWRRRWIGVGVGTALIVNLGVSSFLRMPDGFYAFSVLARLFIDNVSSLFASRLY